MWPPMHQGIESVHQGVLRWFSDLASAENSVKKRTQFFSLHKTGTRSSKFVFYGNSQPCNLSNIELAHFYARVNLVR